jgi:hypothetical protein
MREASLSRSPEYLNQDDEVLDFSARYSEESQ